jgi:hypothetical protein
MRVWWLARRAVVDVFVGVVAIRSVCSVQSFGGNQFLYIRNCPLRLPSHSASRLSSWGAAARETRTTTRTRRVCGAVKREGARAVTETRCAARASG